MGARSVMKVVLIVLNSIFILIGVTALAVGIWAAVDRTKLQTILRDVTKSNGYGKLLGDAAYVIIATGGAIFITSLFGCLGAWKQSKCLLITYSTIVGLMIFLEIAIAVLAGIFATRISDVIKKELAENLKQGSYRDGFTLKGGKTWEYAPPKNDSYKAINAFQLEFKCCGVNSYEDYGSLPKVPLSCCPTKSSGDELQGLVDKVLRGTKVSLELENRYCPALTTELKKVEGCYNSLIHYVKDKAVAILVVFGITLAIQLYQGSVDLFLQLSLVPFEMAFVTPVIANDTE